MGAREEEERQKKELSAIRGAIESRKLRWDAGVTEISRLSEEDKMNMLGAIIEEDRLKSILKRQDEKERRGIERKGESDPVDPPSEWDWRNVAGNNWTTPIRYQDGCGSCVAFGVIGALEMMVKRWVYNDPKVNPDFSEAHLFYCNNRQCKKGDPNVGWWIPPALDYLKANGVPDEACYPYTPYNQPCNTCADWRNRINLTKIKSWKAVYSTTEMKEHLSEQGCLVADFAVYRDFRDYYTGGIYEHASGEYLGGHAVTVVGYDDVDECWICKNSWGTGWGEADGGQRGWFRIAYGECGFDDVMYKMELVCPAEESGVVIGVKMEEIDLVRRFRDRLLGTRKGRAYLNLALRNIGDVTRTLEVLRKDERMRAESAKALRPFIAAVKSLELDERKSLVLQKEYFEAAAVVLDRLARADERLRPAVNRIKREMPMYEGKNLRDIVRGF